MIRNILKLIIAGLLIIGSVFAFVNGLISVGVWSIIVAGFFVLFHFKNQKNLIAFYYVRKNKMDKAAKVLDSVKHPERMIKSQEAYYYYLSGLVASQQHSINKAESMFKKALETGLRMDTDKAVARLNMSGMALRKRNKKLAKYHLQEAKKLDKRKMLTDQFKEIEYMMKRV
ncbi:MAG: hypothetical protein N4A49_03180 [Marinifilaceae bacterium]|jgi:tetratricopeptide (TPR) repeat protein|nr:hypothetical protein [Marinifilaceae bacterium]